MGRTVGTAADLGTGAGTGVEVEVEVGARIAAGSGTAVRMLFGLPAGQFDAPLAALLADASVVELGDTWLDTRVTRVVALVDAVVVTHAGRVEVGAGAVSPGPCARTVGRVRFDRSGRLKTSHGSRLFKGEGPTGEEDNAARAAGPPTG
ncbi:hypothetical protein ACFWXO_29095 [Kitasatospora sp. NPDC059088]|uniref:hypothetical protein n=1 Tax=Kitasatospora sp. NPDC059088 TaxID=3346722 RepID=UPI00369E382B